MNPSFLEMNSSDVGNRVMEVYVHDTFVKVAGVQVWPPSAIAICIGAIVVIALTATLTAIVWRKVLDATPSHPEVPQADFPAPEPRDRS